MFVLGWLLRKSGGSENDRIYAFDGYLDRFDITELSCMGDLEVTDIYLRLSQRQDPYRSVDLVSFIRTVGMAKEGTVQNKAFARSVARGKLRMKLASATKKLMRDPTFSNSIALLGEFKTGVEPGSPYQEKRLADHVIMLERIYNDPLNAPLLPSLEEIGEATNWRRYWCKPA
jgi:hypothetical protein